MINSLLFFIRSLSPSSKAQGSPSTLNIPNFTDILPRLSLENASFLPISNENERAAISTQKRQTEIAKAISEGIMDYLKNKGSEE